MTNTYRMRKSSLTSTFALNCAEWPETEIATFYAEALEAWAVDELGRAPSLPRLHAEVPRQLRPPPRARGAEQAPAAAACAACAACAAPSSSSPIGRGGFGAEAVRRATSSPAANRP